MDSNPTSLALLNLYSYLQDLCVYTRKTITLYKSSHATLSYTHDKRNYYINPVPVSARASCHLLYSPLPSVDFIICYDFDSRILRMPIDRNEFLPLSQTIVERERQRLFRRAQQRQKHWRHTTYLLHKYALKYFTRIM